MKYENPFGLDDLDCTIVHVFAENDMRGNLTAKQLFMCESSVTYHFRKIRKKTGLNPRNFYDLVKLVQAIKKVG